MVSSSWLESSNCCITEPTSSFDGDNLLSSLSMLPSSGEPYMLSIINSLVR